MGTDAFFPSLKAEMFGGGGFDRDGTGVDAEDVGDSLPHLRDIGTHFGALGYNDAVDIAYAVAVGRQEFVAAAEQDFAVDVFVLGVVVGEMFADVAESGSTQQGVTDGVEQHVGIGMAEEPQGVGYFNAAEPQGTVGNQLVYVVA